MFERRRDEADPVKIQVQPGQSESVLRDNAESKRSALDALVPLPAQLKARIPLVTAFRGREPDLIMMLRAQGTLALRNWLSHLNNGSKELDLSLPSPIIEWLKEHAPSVHQERARHIVEIARSTAPPEARPSSWWRRK